MTIEKMKYLPFGVMLDTPEGIYKFVGAYISPSGEYRIITESDIHGEQHDFPAVLVKPYLRPMSAMTKVEMDELKAATCPDGTGYFDEKYLICPMSHYGEHIGYSFMHNILNWLDEHLFDYNMLIEKGDALPAPAGMYKKTNRN